MTPRRAWTAAAAAVSLVVLVSTGALLVAPHGGGPVAALLVAASGGGPAAPPRAFADVRASWCPSDLRVLDRRGELVHELRVDADGRRLAWTPLPDVSPALVEAVVASEDRRFRRHAGVDWLAVCAAAWQGATGGARRGASTIPMQVAALVDPSLGRGNAPRSLAGKWRQMHAARELERTWTKDEILEAYLNLATLRGEVRGVRAAARAIYGKEPAGLTRAEGVALAVSIRAPNAGRAALVARARALQRSLPHAARADEVDEAIAALVDAPDAHGPRADLAPHAARLVAASTASVASAALAAPASDAPAEPASTAPTASVAPAASVPPCGDVATTLDATLQALAADSLRRHLLALGDRSAADGAVLVVDNATGGILAYVGSSGELSAAREVDGVRARRQAGSTLKPFLYASAIERGLVTPATLLEDTPLETTADGRIYRPDNYDHRFRGLVSVRTALASSLNVPAVRTLLLVGADAFAGTLRRLGLAGVTETGDWYGPSLALGSADVSLWELVGAYRALARGGEWTPLSLHPARTEEPTSGGAGGAAGHATSRARDSADAPAATERLETAAAAPHTVFRPSTAHLVSDILSDRGSRATTFDLAGPLATRYWSAVKTGTSKDMRDNWCVGFSRRYTVGVWVGNFSGAPMHDVSGVTGAAPVWRELMDALHEGAPGETPPEPSGVVAAWTAFAHDAEPAREELYMRGSEPSSPQSPLASHPRIAEPADGTVIAIDPDIPPSRQRVALVARDAGDGARWILDRTPLGSAGEPRMWQPVRGAHELELVDRGGLRLDVVRFLVKGPAESTETAGGDSATR